MNIKVLFCIFSLLLFFSSCISEFNAVIPPEDKDIIFVDGNIVGNSEVKFTISKSFSLEESKVPKTSFVTTASLTVVGSDGYQSQPAIHLGDGVYQANIGTLLDDISYAIRIEYNGDTYTSLPATPLVTPEIDSISWVQPIEKEDVSIRVSTHEEGSDPKFYKWNYDEVWENNAIIYTAVFYNPNTDSYYLSDYNPGYYCWNYNNQNKQLIGSTEALTKNSIVNKFLCQYTSIDRRFSSLYCINVTQIAIRKAAYEYFQNQSTLNENMGGLFTPLPSELGGNIICNTNPSKRTMGYVEVTKNITKKRLFITASQITRPTFGPCEPVKRDTLVISDHEFYEMGYRPFGTPESLKHRGWFDGVCLDCTMKGGTKVKPDYWPNDHK